MTDKQPFDPDTTDFDFAELTARTAQLLGPGWSASGEPHAEELNHTSGLVVLVMAGGTDGMYGEDREQVDVIDLHGCTDDLNDFDEHTTLTVESTDTLGVTATRLADLVRAVHTAYTAYLSAG